MRYGGAVAAASGLWVWLLVPVVAWETGAAPAASAAWPATAEADAARLAQPALRVLLETLQRQRPVYSSAAIGELARYTGGDAERARAALEALLKDAAEAWAANAEVRRRLAALGEARLGRRRTERLVDELVAGGRRMVAGDEEYLLSAALDHAAREARVPPAEARAFLKRALESASRGQRPEGSRRDLGIMVAGGTDSYTLSLEPLRLFFGAGDEEWLREQVREIHRFLVPRTAQFLDAAPGVAWALRQRQVTALLEPDAVVGLQVKQLRFTGSNADLRPCVEVAVQVKETASQAPPWEKTVSHCTEEHGSASTRTLEAFYDEVAELLGQAILEAVGGRSGEGGAGHEPGRESPGG